MALETREFDEMVDSVLDRIIAADVGISDKSPGSVIRTIVEAIMAEIDIQNFQIESIYDALDIDNAEGEDLEKLVSIFGVVREPATKCTGKVTFSTGATPATKDITIDSGSSISTIPDADGNIVEFITTTDAILPTGSSSILVDVEAVEPGYLFMSANRLVVISNQIIGIQSVTNTTTIEGGTNEENDDSLRDRAKNARADAGKGTDTALEGAISSIDGVISVTVLDQNRGPGTSDVVVTCTTNPPSQVLQDTISAVVKKTKSSGIDVGVIYPTIKPANIVIVLSKPQYADIALGAINTYFGSLRMGQTFIIRQMESVILSKCNDPGLDITTSAPTTNVTADELEIVRPGTITINGVVR